MLVCGRRAPRVDLVVARRLAVPQSFSKVFAVPMAKGSWASIVLKKNLNACNLGKSLVPSLLSRWPKSLGPSQSVRVPRSRVLCWRWVVRIGIVDAEGGD